MVKPNPLDGHEYDVRRDDCAGVDGRSPDARVDDYVGLEIVQIKNLFLVPKLSVETE
jgi:hypothetical protein